MYNLYIRQDWSDQIAAIRNAVTEDTNLIRFDNSFYRICRNNPDSFFVTVFPFEGRVDKGIRLTIQMKDLYITNIGSRYVERYASTLGSFSPEARTLNALLHDLPTAQGVRLFELQSQLMFCVAESLRSDHIATTVEQTISKSLIGLQGVPAHLPMSELTELARAWGQTSDAIFSSLSEKAKRIVLQARNVLSVEDRQFSERVDLSRTNYYARNIKVLKRPKVR
jgi:hypothetical protein